MEKTTDIAVVPSPGFSHLLPILEFAKRFVQFHQHFHFTFIIPSLGSPSSSSIAILDSLPSNIDSIVLPPINKEDLPEGFPPAVQIQLTVSHSLSFIRDALNSLSSTTNLVAMIADPFASKALDFAKEFNVLSFIYFPSTAMTLSLFFYLPKLHDTVSSEYRDLPEPVRLPGCVPVPGRELPDPIQNRSSEVYRLFLESCKRLHLADGILVNSFIEMETGPLKALTEGADDGIGSGTGNPTIYPVGPIIQTGSSRQSNGSECLSWLDNQPYKSVLYISFGSGGTLSQDQFNELALGLELSGQKFLWVVRPPSNLPNAAYLGAAKEDPLQYLPLGFLERTKEQGFVVPSWAPQIQVLGHMAIGGFLTHCGWNSILESVVNGVPLIAWPLFAEQKMSAAMLTNGFKVAIRPRTNEKGIVEREEVGEVVRRVMEGEEGREMRKRMEELKNAAANAIKENGSSTKTLAQLAVDVTSKGLKL